MSQKNRRIKLGVKDVNDYVKRFDTECGEIIKKQASEDEIAAIKNRISKIIERNSNDRNDYIFKQYNRY